jgi:hypothetical protein
MELTACAKCEVADDIKDVEFKFMDPYYATEILAIADQYPSIEEILFTLTKKECATRVAQREVKLCAKCNIPLAGETRWLLEVPEIYTISIQYESID